MEWRAWAPKSVREPEQRLTAPAQKIRALVRGCNVMERRYKCSHSAALIADRWTDDLRLSDLSPVLLVQVVASTARTCGRISIRKGAPKAMMRFGYDDGAK
jgi:hypothetical protein